MTQPFNGLIAPPVTAMHADGTLDLALIERQAKSLIANGVVGAFVCGTTGEGVSLTSEERMQVTREWRSAAAKDFRLIVHVGHTSAREACRLAEHAEQVGADAVACSAPTFFRPASLDQLVDFCSQVASATSLPFYYYHIPAMTTVELAVSEFLAAASPRIPTLAGAKFTFENLMDYALCLQLEGGRFEMLFGRDEILLSALALGARGAVGTTYNFAAPVYQRMVRAYQDGDMASAQGDQLRAIEMIRALRRVGGGPAGAKAAMKLIGIDCGPVRAPIANVTEEQLQSLRTELEQIGFFDFCCKAP